MPYRTVALLGWHDASFSKQTFPVALLFPVAFLWLYLQHKIHWALCPRSWTITALLAAQNFATFFRSFRRYLLPEKLVTSAYYAPHGILLTNPTSISKYAAGLAILLYS